MYLNLMKKCLTASLYEESSWQFVEDIPSDDGRSLLVMERVPVVSNARREGRDWPLFGYTMIGERRLDNLHECMDYVTGNGVPGDFMEAGVWRGGATIFMRAYLCANGIEGRRVWVADSFEGMPEPTEGMRELDLRSVDYLKVSLETVKDNFARFGLLDDRVRFLKGWFCDTLSRSEIEQLAVLRLDGDMYEATRDALRSLYPRVSDGGWVIVDDYYNENWKGCRRAVDEYLAENQIEADMQRVDWTASCWKVVKH